MIKHYLSIAFRNLLRNKFQSLLSIVGLAVAFFCFGICAYFVRGWIEVDQYYDNHDRVLELTQSHNAHGIVGPKIEEVLQQFPEIESIFRFNVESNTYLHQEWEQNIDLLTIECDTTLRHIYNPRLIAGSWEAAENSPNSMLMTESYARKLYGDPINAIGKTLNTMGGKRYSADAYSCPSYTIQAVVEDLAYNNTIQPFCPLAAWVMNDTDGKINHGQQEYVIYYDPRILLREGTDIADFQARLESAQIHEHSFSDWIIVADKTFDPEVVYHGEIWVFVILLSIIVLPGLLVLLSALSNFFNLLLTSIMMRRREYTLRRAHGAHTWDLWLMVSTQIVITMILVGFCTLLIVELCAPILHIQLDETNQLILDPHEMISQSIQHIGILLLIGLFVAWLAVARIRKDSLQEAMKTSTGRRPGRHIGRNIMMGWQMTIGFVFIIFLAAMILQIQKNEEVRIPWLSADEKKEIVELPLMVNSGQQRNEMESELKAIPSIKEMTFKNNNMPMFQMQTWLLAGFCTNDGDSVYASVSHCDLSVFHFLQVPLLEGRWPEKDDEVLVDSRFVAHNGVGVGTELTTDTDLLNRNGYRITSERVTIVGIIDDPQWKTHPNTKPGRIPLESGIYFITRDEYGFFCCRCYPGQLNQMRNDLAKYMKEHSRIGNFRDDEDLSGALPTLYDEIRKDNNLERQFLGLFWLFAIIAIIITLLGIYSAITMDTTMRRKEMAIRKINGAKARHIIAQFCRLYVVLLIVAALIVFPLTYILFDYIAQVGYRNAFNYGFLFYGSIFLLMALFVALTIGTQVYKIARINPAKIVKSE